MLSLSDYEVISGSENSFRVKDKLNGEYRSLRIIEFKDLADFKTQSLVSRLFSLQKIKPNPHLVKCFDHFVKESSSTIHVIMEMIEGIPLFRLIDQCREENLQFEETYIWRVMSQLHSVTKIICCGTLSTKNVFVDKRGDVKWDAIGNDNTSVPLGSQLGYLITEMCTAGETTFIPSSYTKELKKTIYSLVLGEEVSLKFTASKEYPKLCPRVEDEEVDDLVNIIPNIYETIVYAEISSPDGEKTKKLSPKVEDELKSKLNAIQAQEVLLRQKDLKLVQKEKELYEKEKDMNEREGKFKIYKHRYKRMLPPKRPPKEPAPDDENGTDDESNESSRSQIPRANIPPLPPRTRPALPKKFPPMIPKKFMASLASVDSDSNNNTKSIFCVFGVSCQKPKKISDVKDQVAGIKKWTNEKQKAAFEMLAAMNARGYASSRSSRRGHY